MKSNYLEKIQNHYFIELKNLKIIDLSRNCIKFIETNSFKDQVVLEVLFLSNNQLESIQSGLFVNLRKLKLLYLNQNNIKTSKGEFFNIINISPFKSVFMI